MLGGEQLGAFCLSETHDGAKAWTTHGGQADFYTALARTSDDERRGISCFLVPADTPGLVADTPERKMGLTGSTTAAMLLTDSRVPLGRHIGAEGDGLSVALAGLTAGRLGIAAVATGVAASRTRHVPKLMVKLAVLLPRCDERQRRPLMAAEARALWHGGVRARRAGAFGQRAHGPQRCVRTGGR